MRMLRILEPSTEYNTVLNSEFLRSTGFKTNYFYFEFIIMDRLSDKLSTIKFSELVDINKVKQLIQLAESKNLFLPRWFNKHGDKTPDELTDEILQKLRLFEKQYISTGVITTRYTYTIPKFGRVYTKGRFVSLGFFPREIHSFLACDNYIDIDIENCHPVLTLQLCEKYGIQCTELKNYIEHRNEYLEKVMTEFNVSRDSAKILFLQMMYGGSYKSWCKNNGIKHCEIPGYITRFNTEIHDMYPKLLEYFKPEIKYLKAHGKPEKTYNENGSLVSWIMQNYERKILECMVGYIKEHGLQYQSLVLCFDGFNMLKSEFKTKLLNELEKHVEDTLGFKIKLSVKEFTTTDIKQLIKDPSIINTEPNNEINSMEIFTHDIDVDSLGAFDIDVFKLIWKENAEKARHYFNNCFDVTIKNKRIKNAFYNQGETSYTRTALINTVGIEFIKHYEKIIKEKNSKK